MLIKMLAIHTAIILMSCTYVRRQDAIYLTILKCLLVSNGRYNVLTLDHNDASVEYFLPLDIIRIQYFFYSHTRSHNYNNKTFQSNRVPA